MSDAARQSQARDWLDDLREFSPAVVQGACQRWRRLESRRPTPADIRNACFEEMRDYPGFYDIVPRQIAERTSSPDATWHQPTPEDIAYVDRIIERMKGKDG